LGSRVNGSAKGWPAGSKYFSTASPTNRSQENAKFNEKSFINMAMNLIKANNNTTAKATATTTAKKLKTVGETHKNKTAQKKKKENGQKNVGTLITRIKRQITKTICLQSFNEGKS